MPSRTRNLAIGIGLFLVVVAILWSLAPEPEGAGDSPFDPGPVAGSAPVAATGTPVDAYGAYGSTGSPATVQPAGWKQYAIGLHELKGLAPNAAPGTQLELWVSWEPPLVDEPRVQRLLRRVVLDKIIAPLTDGPLVALLLVPPHDVRPLLYGHQYGKLSALVVR